MGNGKPPIVEIKHLSKSIGGGARSSRVLEDITFNIADGEFPCPHGAVPVREEYAGSTSLPAIDKADQGSIRGWGGGYHLSVSSRSCRVGVPATWFIFPVLQPDAGPDSLRNVELRTAPDPDCPRGTPRTCGLALPVVGLSDRMNHYPAQLSGGQAAAGGHRPGRVSDRPILVADEPTGDLDRVSAGEIDLQLIGPACARIPVRPSSWVTHDAPGRPEKAHVIKHLEKGILTAAYGNLLPGSRFLITLPAYVSYSKAHLRNSFRHKLRSALPLSGCHRHSPPLAC